MPISVSHALTATTPDDPAYEIRPSHWNSAHVAVMSATAGTEIYGAFSNDPAYNVSFSTNGAGQVVASANVTAAPSPVNVTGVNGSSVNAQTIAFSQANGLTLGVSTAANGATVTGSYTVPTVPTAYVSSVNGSSGAISLNVGSSLSSSTNGSSITFGLASNITTALQPAGNYLTTARASNDAIGLNSAVSNVTATINSSGLSLDARGYAGTATAITGGAAITLNSGGMSFNGSGLAGVGTSATNASITLNSAGLAISVAAPGGGGNFSAGLSNVGNTSGDTGVTGTRLVFAGGNNITLSQSTNANGATITVSGANAGGAQTGISGVIASNATYTSGTISFADGNGVSFGSGAGQAVSITHGLQFTSATSAITSNALHTSSPRINVSAGTTSNNLSALTFANSNGITFGLNASTLTASHNGLTTARASNDAVGLNTAQSNVTWTVNSSGLSLDARGYAGTGTSATNASITLNSAGLAISVAAPGGAASQTLYATGNTTVNSSGTMALSSLLMRGYGIVSLGTSNGSILVSAPDSTSYNAYSVGFSTGGNTAGDTGFGTDRVVFAGGANITLSGSTNAGSATISIVGGGGGANSGTFYAQSNTTQSSSGTIALSSLNFAGAGIASVGITNGSVVVSVPSGGGAGMSLGMSTQGNTAGTTGLVSNNYLMVGTGPISLSQSVNGQSATLSINAPATSSLSATGQLSISTNGSTISIGVGRTISGMVLGPFAGLGGPLPAAQSSISLGQNSLYLYPVQMEDYVTVDHFRMPVLVTNSSSAAASVQKGLTYQVGVYTRHSTNGTVYSRHYSTSYTIAASHSSNASWMLSMITAIGNSTSYNTLTASSAGLNLSASLHGPREFIMPVSSVFAPGEYIIGIVQSSSSVGAGGAVLNVSNMAHAYQTYNRPGVSTNATGSGFFQFMGAGTYSATTGALPASINATQVNQLGTLPYLFAATGTV